MKRGWRNILNILPAVAVFAIVIVMWEFATTVFGIREYLLPSPASVVRAMFSHEINWAEHAFVTAVAIFGAFLLAAISGVLLGTLIAWSSVLGRALMPFLVFINTLPKVAVAPLFLLWLGYGILPNMLIGALIGFLPVVINTAVGCRRSMTTCWTSAASSTRRNGRYSRRSGYRTPIPTF